MKFFVIIAICLGTWTGTAFGASCTPSSTAPSNYTLESTYDYSSSACVSKTTSYYSDSTTKTYIKVVSCNSCSGTGTYLTSTAIYPYGCGATINLCDTCKASSTVPSGYSSTGPTITLTGCASSTQKYLGYETGRVYFTVKDCNSCQSGYHIVQKKVSTSSICSNHVYHDCERCGPGYYYYQPQNACKKCESGTYSDSYETWSCTTCPAPSDIFINSTRTTNPSVANGYISSPEGSNSQNQCQLKSGTYYEAVGTFKYENIAACAYDGTVIESPADKCATITYKCSSTNNNQTAMAVSNGSIPALSGVSGKYCWCETNNKYFYFTTIGTDDTMCSSGCLSACTSVISNNPGLRTNLGCN